MHRAILLGINDIRSEFSHASSHEGMHSLGTCESVDFGERLVQGKRDPVVFKVSFMVAKPVPLGISR